MIVPNVSILIVEVVSSEGMEKTDLNADYFLCGFLIVDCDVGPRTISEALKDGPVASPI